MGITNIFVTGPIHSGKSTILNKVIASLPHLTIGGFRTLPLYKNHQPVGFVLESLAGERHCFAHVDMNSNNQFYVYKFDYQVFETHGVMALESALVKCDVILMDEIGMMEEPAIKFRHTIIKCLNEPKMVLGTVQQRATWFLNILRERGDTKIFISNKDNGHDLSNKILFFIHNLPVISTDLSY